MTPIEKNVRVVDEQGNEYEATYPKRAKGLVKNGRARFVNENTICLACPPDKMKEDRIMSDTEIIIDQATGEVKETREEARKAAESAAEFTKAFEEEFSALTKAGEEDPSNRSFSAPEQYTIGYALAQLEKIRVESARFSDEVRRSAENVKSAGPGGVGAAAAGNALMELIKEQQATYHKLIDFYAGMIAELKAEKREAQKDQKSQNDLKRTFLDFVADCAPRVQAGAFQPDYQAIWDIMNK